MTPLSPLNENEWNREKARHLLNRAGFGVPQEVLDRLEGMGPHKAVDYLLNFETLEEPNAEPDFLIDPSGYLPAKSALAAMDPETRKGTMRDLRKIERQAVKELQAWWLERMLRTRAPLREKMTLFWHGHFATSAQKVYWSGANYRLNSTFRENATGNFKDLTRTVGQSTAMLRYLDNVNNKKARPNENWARELMELFTLGQGNYTEDDIKESARAFTGWSTAGKRFRYNIRVHDFGEKSFFQKKGDFDGWDIIDIIFEHPAAAEFIAGKLWRFFASESEDQQITRELAQTLRHHKYKVKPLLRKMFLSQAFYSPEIIGTQIKSPIQFVVQLVHHLGIENPPHNLLTRFAGQLGQRLFYPPNVKGWDGGKAWINANTLLTRYNMPMFLMTATSRAARADRSQNEMSPPTSFQGMEGATRQNRTQALEASSMHRPQGGPSTPVAPWNPRNSFASLKFSTVGECVDALADHFFHVPLTREQKNVFRESLGLDGNPSTPLKPSGITGHALRQTLRLVFGTANYQLC